MKFKSKTGQGVYFEHWSTPLDQAQSIWLTSMVMSSNMVHLIFNLEKGSANVKFVMSLGRGWPIRMTDEGYAVGCIGKYFEKEKTVPKLPKNCKSVQFKTWKLWGTKYIKEIDENHALSEYKQKKDTNIFQYLIITQDEWIEFICPGEPEWNIHKNSSTQKLIDSYSKKIWKPI